MKKSVEFEGPSGGDPSRNLMREDGLKEDASTSRLEEGTSTSIAGREYLV